MKEGPDMRSDSREPVRIDIYLNMLYSYFVSLYLYECLGPSEVRRRLKFGICLHFQGASFPVSSVSFVRIYMLA